MTGADLHGRAEAGLRSKVGEANEGRRMRHPGDRA